MTANLRILLPVILAVAFCAGAQSARAQAEVSFSNTVSNRVMDCLTGGPVTNGPTFLAALYFAPDGTTSEASFMALGTPVTFTLPGRYNGGNRTVPGATGGNAFMFQVRVWEAAYGSTWDEALAAGPNNCRRPSLGKSMIVRVVPGAFPNPPASLNIPSFTVCPSPCVSVTCPSNIVVITNNPAGAAVTYGVSSTNTCCPSSTNTVVNCSPPSGSVFPPGTNVVNCTITDGIGPSNTCFFLVIIRVPVTHYASLTGGHAYPYTNWAGAATNIQSAVNAANDGDTVFVARGDYVLPFEVFVGKAILLQSTNDRTRTFLSAQGQFTSRCLRIQHSGAIVDGFTLRNGSPPGDGSGGGVLLLDGTVRNCTITNCQAIDAYGGGVYMNGGVLSNCLVIGNSLGAYQLGGGGVFAWNGGRIENCQILRNHATYDGSGVYLRVNSQLRNSIVADNLGSENGVGVYAEEGSTIYGCTITNNFFEAGFGGEGGGAFLRDSEMDRCVVAYNGSAVPVAIRGGGVFCANSVIRNSLLVRNIARTDVYGNFAGSGGGIYLFDGSVINCTVANNRAEDATNSVERGQGGGVFVEAGTVTNTIIFANAATSNANWYASTGLFTYVCTTPNPGGVGNIISNPSFVSTNAFNYRLAAASPCVNTGTNQPWMIAATDLDANPRIALGRVDIGAYELYCTAPPQILAQPSPQTNCAFSTALFAVTASGGQFYQWQFNGTNLADGGRIDGANTTTLSIYNLTPSDAGNYRVLITNACGLATSVAASLTVRSLPAIGLNPVPQTNCAGGIVVFSATESGSFPKTLRWQKNGVDVMNDARINGATGTNLVITGLLASDAGNYSLFVSNACGTTNSFNAALTVRTPPTVPNPFISIKRSVGTNLAFTITPGGSTPRSVQWRFNGVNLTDGGRILGSRTTVLTIANAQPSDSGIYSVVVSNLCGSVTNNIADVIVADCPQITLQPVDDTQCVGSTTVFRIAANGTPPVSVRWYFYGDALNDDERITGASTTNLTISNLQLYDAGPYYAIVSNACGATNTVGVELVVLAPPEITVQPVDVVAYEGATVIFSNAAISSLTNYYQWRFNGIDLPSETNTVLMISEVTKAAAGDYTVVVANSCGSVTSVVATLAVPDCLLITANPVSREVSPEASVTFSVTPAGAGPFFYQWQFNGAPLTDDVLISGSTGPQLEIAEVGAGHVGEYTVVISNGCGSLASDPATLTLKTAFIPETAPPGIGNLRLSKAGILKAIVVQPDGRMIVGGVFSSISGVPRNNLARLNPDGLVDATWNPNVSGFSVDALALDGTELFVGGDFTRIGGEFRNGMAKLSTINNGAADPVWNPNVSGLVRAIAVSGTNVFIGGYFDYVGGVARYGLAKLSRNGTGAADVLWNADLSYFAEAKTLVIAGGQLYVGGSFTSVRGEERSHLARLALGGGGVVDGSWIPNPDGEVTALAASGYELFVGGSFSTIADESRAGMAKFQIGIPALDSQWVGVDAGPVYSLGLRGTNLYAAAARGMVKLRTTGSGSQDSLWRPNLLSETNVATINAVAVTDSAVFAGGFLTDASAVVAAGMAKLNVFNGARVPGFGAQLELPGTVFAIARQDDGRVIIGGHFLFAGGLVRRNLARVNLDSTVDGTWKPPVVGPGGVWEGSTVRALAVQGTELFVGGIFGKVGTNNQSYLAKVDVGGSDAVDATWKPVLDGAVFSLLPNGSNLFVGGEFAFVNGERRLGICKLAAPGSGLLDTNWDAALDGIDIRPVVYALKLDGTNLYVGGEFDRVGDFGMRNLARVNASGSGAIDEAWDPDPSGEVRALAVGTGVAAGWLYVGGSFSGIGSADRNNLARVNMLGSGEADLDWEPEPDDTVWALQGVGDNLYVGGAFRFIGDHDRSFLAKVSGAGLGELDAAWKHEASYDPEIFNDGDSAVRALLANGEDLHVGGAFTEVDGVHRVGYVFLPVPDAPSMFVSSNAVIIQRNGADGAEITGFRVTDIVGGDLFHNDGTTLIHEGEWVTVAEGGLGLKFVGTNEGAQTVTAVSAFNQTAAGTGTAAATLDVGVGGVPAFSFSQANYQVAENVDPALVEVTILKHNHGAANVSFVWQPVTAQPYQHHQGDVLPLGNVTTFYFGADQTSTNIEFFVYNDSVREGDEEFVVTLLDNSPGSIIVQPSDAIVTILDDECTGEQGSFMTNNPPAPLPPLTGALKLTLAPPSGQWRLAGDPIWRTSEETATGMSAGVYDVGFRPVEFRQLLLNMSFEVNEGLTTAPPAVIEYPQIGPVPASTDASFTVNIFPAEVAPLATWRAVGYPEFHPSGDTVTLQAGTYELQFTEVVGWKAPRDVFASLAPGLSVSRDARYTRADPTLNTRKPVPVEVSQAFNEAPYYYNGLIESEVPSESGREIRFGSGVVVKERVVLTAAHVLFDEVNFTFVTRARWYLQKYRGANEARPQAAQGWYIRAGYDAKRRAEATTPGATAAASQSLDIAAMFFEGADNSPGRGGFGGFLASNGDGNEWLRSTREKILVGYPLDPDVPANHGKMHATNLTSAFQFLRSGVFANTDLQSFPGNSGGPLYVRADDGRFYPAAVYLGGSGEAVVRAIDRDVVCLINSAEQTGKGGGHHVGGGVALWEVGGNVSEFDPGLFGVNFEPPQIRSLARWHVVRSATDISKDYTMEDLVYPTEPGSFTVAFLPLSGWGTPTNQLGIAFSHQVNRITVEYVPLLLTNALVRSVDGAFRFLVQGAPGRRYKVHAATDLTNPPNWINLTNLILEQRTGRVLDPLPRPDFRFYRVKEDPFFP